MKPISHFRRWLAEIWRQNCDEYLAHNQLPYSLPEYWNRYKYWLKREYRHQQKSNKMP
jgi:hypothetical protein